MTGLPNTTLFCHDKSDVNCHFFPQNLAVCFDLRKIYLLFEIKIAQQMTI
jgi:hypothetical protein